MKLPFQIVNVFTQGDDRFSGNPLAVFEDAHGLDDATMQRLALQFNLLETMFVLPSNGASARVRIFTPGYEMPFTGHPTLGTAYVVSTQQHGAAELALELLVGRIPITRVGQRWQLRANAPTARSSGLGPDSLAALLGLSPSDLAGEALWVNTGNEQLPVPLRNEQVQPAEDHAATGADVTLEEDGIVSRTA